MSDSKVRIESSMARVLKGRGFKPRRKVGQMIGGFSRWGRVLLAKHVAPAKEVPVAR